MNLTLGKSNLRKDDDDTPPSLANLTPDEQAAINNLSEDDQTEVVATLVVHDAVEDVVNRIVEGKYALQAFVAQIYDAADLDVDDDITLNQWAAIVNAGAPNFDVRPFVELTNDEELSGDDEITFDQAEASIKAAVLAAAAKSIETKQPWAGLGDNANPEVEEDVQDLIDSTIDVGEDIEDITDAMWEALEKDGVVHAADLEPYLKAELDIDYEGSSDAVFTKPQLLAANVIGFGVEAEEIFREQIGDDDYDERTGADEAIEEAVQA